MYPHAGAEEKWRHRCEREGKFSQVRKEETYQTRYKCWVEFVAFLLDDKIIVKLWGEDSTPKFGFLSFPFTLCCEFPFKAINVLVGRLDQLQDSAGSLSFNIYGSDLPHDLFGWKYI